MASIIQRKNGVWYGVFSYRGKRVWRTTGTRSFEEAKQRVIVMAKDYVDWRRMTVMGLRSQLSEILEGQLQYSTVRLYEYALRDFARLVGDKQLRAVRPFDVERFKSLRLKEVTATKVAMDYRHLKASFTRAVKFGMIEKNPFKEVKNVKIPEQEPLYIKPAEFDRLLELTNDQQLKAIMIFAVSTSMRVGEIVNVRMADIDFDGREIQLKNRPDFVLKGKRRRAVPLNDTCLSLLATLRPEGEFLFSNRRGGKLSAKWVSDRFRRAVRKAGLPKRIHFHSLRHTGASWMVQAGVPLAYVQRILGHSSITTTQIYVHAAPRHLHESVGRLDALLRRVHKDGPALAKPLAPPASARASPRGKSVKELRNGCTIQ